MILFYILFAALVKLKKNKNKTKTQNWKQKKENKKTKKKKKHKGNSVNSVNENVLNNPMQVKTPSQMLRVKSYNNNNNKTTNTNTTATITKSVHSTWIINPYLHKTTYYTCIYIYTIYLYCICAIPTEFHLNVGTFQICFNLSKKKTSKKEQKLKQCKKWKQIKWKLKM